MLPRIGPDAKSFILRAMLHPRTLGIRTASFVALLTTTAVMFGGYFYLYGQDKSAFPDGLDAVQAAPASHKVVFENAFVRVLEVTIPPAGKTEPMHHHRWPSFFLSWDSGGPTPHIRYHARDGSVRDAPSVIEPVHAARWSIHWMKPEPLHGIETVELPKGDQPSAPPLLRVEIKCHLDAESWR